MSKSKNYTITSLSSSLNQISKRVFTAASNTRIRGGYAPYTLVKSKKGDVEGKEEFPKFPFGRFGPVARRVTAADNLIHWWKLTEDPAEGESVDYGTSGSAATNLTVVDASTATGPTELGSPTVFKFDGVNDIVKTQIIDGSGTKNSIADLMDSNYYTITFWMKDNGVTSSEVCWTTSGVWTSNSLRDGGQGFFNEGGGGLYIYWRPAASTRHWLRSQGTTGWKHYAIVTDLRTVSGAECVGIGYVDTVANSDATLTDGNPHYSSYAGGATNYWFSIGGLIQSSDSAAVQFSPIEVCDFRMYDRLLTPTEISAIAAGDW